MTVYNAIFYSYYGVIIPRGKMYLPMFAKLKNKIFAIDYNNYQLFKH